MAYCFIKYNIKYICLIITIIALGKQLYFKNKTKLLRRKIIVVHFPPKISVLFVCNKR